MNLLVRVTLANGTVDRWTCVRTVDVIIGKLFIYEGDGIRRIYNEEDWIGFEVSKFESESEG